MSMKPNILYSLDQSRRMLEGMIKNMKSEEDWVFQTHPEANHGLWVVGHIGLADNMFLSRMNEEKGNKPEGWDELFWYGSEIKGDRSLYPETETVLSYFRERRETLLKEIEAVDDSFLTSPTPDEGMFSDAPNMGQMLLFISYHEGLHTGQFSIASRGLGNSPLFTPS